MDPAPKRPALGARGWKMPDSLAPKAPTPRAVRTPRAATPTVRTPTPMAEGTTPFSKRLTSSHFGSSSGAGSSCTFAHSSRAPRSRVGPNPAGAEDIQSDEDMQVPSIFQGFASAPPIPPERDSAPPDDETVCHASVGPAPASRPSSSLVSGLNLTSEQLGVMGLPAAGSRGTGGRRSHGPLGQQAQRALLGVEADRSMLNARHGLGGKAPLCTERLKKALSTPGLAPLLLRTVGATDATQPLVALACEQLHPAPARAGAHVTVLVHRQLFEMLSAATGGAPVDLLLLPPWLEHSGMLMAHHCQSVGPGAAEQALAGRMY